ncbi:pyridoxal 4-dehydrogenase [Paraphotobacterium marinum]|uniref:Pyridoxal 4-dehydrogenase n=1 Tax=Paraphotobacterium marinum TaxID=1755811 RepID=A0A220VGA2_9GAMM|nr:aldo/keto reductase [Paraphotobacterium marinum]ASK79280.1 pyridoxal 4-dehydrogenase [Paraphotobacterium marinum]
MRNYGLQKNLVGQTSIKISNIGFGGASIGNLFRSISNEQANQAVQKSVELGINYFDTAPRYGHGLSERRLGDSLRIHDREKLIISSKVGRILKPIRNIEPNTLRHGFQSPMPFDEIFDYSYHGIMRSFEDSLQRLGTSHIDIMYIHDIGEFTHQDMNNHYYAQLKNGGFRALEELKKDGSIKAIGIGVNETEICNKMLDDFQLDVILLASRYTLLEQESLNHFFPKCKELKTSVVIGGAYNTGILATGVNNYKCPIYNYEKAPQSIIEKVRVIENICLEYSVSLPAVALQFVLANENVASVIPGLAKSSRVEDTLALLNQDIPSELWSKLVTKGIISETAPLPRKQVELDYQ